MQPILVGGRNIRDSTTIALEIFAAAGAGVIRGRRLRHGEYRATSNGTRRTMFGGGHKGRSY
jgi:hypothetical protein